MSVNLPRVSLMSVGAPLMFVFAYVCILQFLTSTLVSEKETLMKQHMLMMGMKHSAYWYVTCVCDILLIAMSDVAQIKVLPVYIC